ncbi:p53 and DNA damage-regulated protein 1-like [Littorina saxatilis]|uniref:P53 and DNA damage-regulated protein 1 n=1 Tax=Littorina saxatilis TaxID=31220 RepID=A0AAN9C0Q8_9CAEN
MEEKGAAPIDSQQLLEHLAQVEDVAEEILTDKQKLIDLNHHWNQTREAMRVLQKDKSDNKQWVCMGNMFIKMEKKSTSRLIEKDFDQTAQEIAKTRTELKPKLSHIRDLEHKEGIKGFHLQPLSKTEIAAINELI